MICSMTGFAAATSELAQYALSLDLRAVNHRFLDIQFRLPDELRSAETGLRELIVAHVQRGKIECRVNLLPISTSNGFTRLNTELIKELRQLDLQVRELLPDCEGLRVSDVLGWPHILQSESISAEALKTGCHSLLHVAIHELNQSRQREGEKLKTIILERVSSIENLVALIAPKMPQLVAAHQEKLSARLREVIATSDEDRIRQEVVLFASKIDIDEELSRLKTHLKETRRTLEHGGTVGKRLDFLVQELNRETNTIGSKSTDIAISQTVVNIKVLIEQVREQIQNIE